MKIFRRSAEYLANFLRIRSVCTTIRACSSASETKGPLQGLRVLDLTRILAGPFCTMLLGDLGAEVIKIERPGIGDETRYWGPPFHKDQSCYFLSINRNKKSVAVDLKDAYGKEVLKELAKKSDVLIENYVPGKLDELGLGYEALHKEAPSLIYCSITGYGSDGPYSSRTGYDVVAAAMGGLLHITGPENGEPCRVGVAMTDLSTGLFAKGAVLAALYERQRTGLGQKIECNLLSSQVAILTHIAASYLIAGNEAKRYGTGHPSIVPYQAFQTKDGSYIIIGAGNNGHYQKLCEKLHLPELTEDPQFETNEKRVVNRSILIPILSKRFKEKNLEEWLDDLEGSGIPYGPVNSMQQVFNDPQVTHNGMILDLHHPSAGYIQVPGPPVKYSSDTRSMHLPPPRLGEHTSQVLEQVLGYSRDKLEALRTSGSIEML